MPKVEPPENASPRPAPGDLVARPDAGAPDARRRGRRVAAALFLGFVIPWVLYISAQIVQQVLSPEVVQAPWAGCEAGQAELHRALVRARGTAEGDMPPDDALRRFREGLGPEWGYLEGVRGQCTSQEQRRSLDALERLRYAEEHAVRREAASLATLRRQVASAIAPTAESTRPPGNSPGDHP